MVFGTSIISRNSEISSIEDINEIANCIVENSKEKINDIGIASYQLICVEEEEEENNLMTEEEHNEVLRELSKKWLCKTTPDGTYIRRVYVDYRKDRRDMDRVIDEIGNAYFINEMEEKEND